MAAGDVLFEREKAVPLRTFDAVHLVVRRTYRLYPFYTFDDVMMAAADRLSIPLGRIDP